jgi:hypothetical protein
MMLTIGLTCGRWGATTSIGPKKNGGPTRITMNNRVFQTTPVDYQKLCYLIYYQLLIKELIDLPNQYNYYLFSDSQRC